MHLLAKRGVHPSVIDNYSVRTLDQHLFGFIRYRVPICVELQYLCQNCMPPPLAVICTEPSYTKWTYYHPFFLNIWVTFKRLHKHVTIISIKSLDLLYLSHILLARMLTMFFIKQSFLLLFVVLPFINVNIPTTSLELDENIKCIGFQPFRDRSETLIIFW